MKGRRNQPNLPPRKPEEPVSLAQFFGDVLSTITHRFDRLARELLGRSPHVQSAAHDLAASLLVATDVHEKVCDRVAAHFVHRQADAANSHDVGIRLLDPRIIVNGQFASAEPATAGSDAVVLWLRIVNLKFGVDGDLQGVLGEVDAVNFVAEVRNCGCESWFFLTGELNARAADADVAVDPVAKLAREAVEEGFWTLCKSGKGFIDGDFGDDRRFSLSSLGAVA